MTRGKLDFGRLREAIAGPGVDPRTWITTGRVDDDPAAIRWEEPFGWVVDVTFTGGALDGDGPNPCRVASWLAGQDQAFSAPQVRNSEVIVVIPEGNPNTNPIIVGMIHNGDDNAAPLEVNGTPVTQDYALANQITVVPGGVDQQVGGDVRVKAGGVNRQLAPLVELAEQGASQAYIRGNDYTSSEEAFLSALNAYTSAVLVFAGSIGAPVPVVAALTAATTLFQTAAAQFSPSSHLSTRVKAE